MEMTVRSAMHQAGAAALTEFLQFPVPDGDQRTVPCACGHDARYQELRAKPVLTAVGKVKVLRPYYLCAHCHAGQFPADIELDIENTEFSPGVRRMQAIVGQQAPFDQGREQMKVLAGVEVTTKGVERTAEAIGEDIARCEQREIQRAVQLDLPIVVGDPVPILYVQMDGTGVPVVNKETLARPGKVDGQPAHTREAKLGCVFTQTTCDNEGHPIRDPDSTTYTGAIETAEEFGKRLYLEAWKRGWSRAEKKVVMGDGAEWIWNLAEQHFPSAVQIVDLYHARQHLWDLARKLHPNDETSQRAWVKVHQKRLLDKGKIEKLVDARHHFHQRRTGREDSHRSRLLCQERGANAVSAVSPSTSVCRLGCHRGRLQDCNRLPSQAVRHVLDCPWSQRHSGPSMLSSQRPL